MIVVFLVFCIFQYSAGLDVIKILSNGLERRSYETKCLEGLGCFDTGYPFKDPKLRPTSYAPFDLEKMKTKFLLFTRRNKKQPYDLKRNVTSLNASPFNEENPTKFIIHGYLRYFNENDNIYKMKSTLLVHGDYNVIIVDWSSSNGYPYPQAVANTRVVGAQIAQMIRYLQENRRLTPQSIHLIGQSLGAHVAGYAGERIAHISRITALDPAGPYFTKTENKVRLDSSDADFVDAIHTDAPGKDFGWGTEQSMGHLDFFVNGGEEQPACAALSTSRNSSGIGLTYVDMIADGGGIYTLLFCDHYISEQYFTVTINETCSFVGTSCDSYENYLNGHCNSNEKAKMGFFAKKPSTKLSLYLQTSNAPPFYGCLNP